MKITQAFVLINLLILTLICAGNLITKISKGEIIWSVLYTFALTLMGIAALVIEISSIK